MHVSFYGAVREVTGSMHLITTGQDRILLDCGLFQGRRQESKEKNKVMPFDPRILTNVVLSHAHIDHSGRLPLLTRKDFTGRIIATRATAAACEYLLPDSAHIQESDAEYLNYKLVRSALREMGGTTKEGKKHLKSLKKDKHKLDIDRINELIDRFHLDAVRPLYSSDDAEEALSRFDGNP
ncbi:MAG: MBL fold metallo-hydrolase, partial [Desulfobacterales bacterium]